VVDTPTRGRRRSSSVTLSPPTLSPAYDFEQSQSVPLRIGRAASLQRAASSQRRSQRPPSLSSTQWTGSYDSPNPPIDRTLRPTILQLGPLSINLGRLAQIKRLCRSVLTFASLDQRLIHAFIYRKWRHLYRWLPRFSQIVYTLRLHIRICDRTRRYLQAI